MCDGRPAGEEDGEDEDAAHRENVSGGGPKGKGGQARFLAKTRRGAKLSLMDWSRRFGWLVLVCGCASGDERILADLARQGFPLGSGQALVAGDEWIESAGVAHGGIGARLPAAFGPVEVTLGATRKIAFEPVGATAVRARVAGSVTVYADAWPGADVVYEAAADRVKEIIYVRRASAPLRYAFVAPGLGPDLTFAGGRLGVAPPFAIDAAGRRVDLAWKRTGDELAVEIPAGLAYPVAIDPTVVLVGWTERTPASNNPPARRFAAMAWDPVRHVAVFFGGEDGSNTKLADTWEWSSSSRTWAQKDMVMTPPSARTGHAMVWDGTQILLFGGNDGADKQDLYSYDPAASGGKGKWNAVTTTGGPPGPRHGHAMVRTSLVGPGDIVLVGGQGAMRFGDAWILRGTVWTPATLAGDPLSARTEHAMIWDGMRLVVHGGETAIGLSSETFIGTVATNTLTWLQRATDEPPARRAALFTYHDDRTMGLLFGGWAGIGPAFPDMWAWDPVSLTWATVSTSAPPPGRYGSVMVRDDTRKVLTLFSGGPVATTGDTWEGDLTLRLAVASAATRTLSEGQVLSFDVVGKDLASAATALTLSWAMSPVPPSGPVTGTVTGPGMAAVQPFSWMPGCTDASAIPYALTFTLSGGVPTLTSTINVTVTASDCPPTVSAPATASFKVGHPGSFMVSAADGDEDFVTLTLDPITTPRPPQVVPSFPSVTGKASVMQTFTWTPGPLDVTGVGAPFQATFRATANGVPVPSSPATALTVVPNTLPTLTAPATATFAEGTPGTFDVSAADATDNDPLTLTLTAFVGTSGTPNPSDPPAFSASGTGAAGGTVSWTPGFLDAGTYQATFAASDGIDTVTKTVAITVTNTNRAPTVAFNPDQNAVTISEGQALTFAATVQDVDTDDTLTIDAGGAPTGANVAVAGATATLTWTPSFTQGSRGAGTPYTITFTGHDNRGGATPRTLTVTVLNTNRPPVFDAVAAQTVAEGELLSFTVHATDPDGETLTYSAPALPPGAGFDPGNLTFGWLPGCQAADTGGGAYGATFQVTDGEATASLTVGITVTGEVIVVTPAPIDFPATRVGESATPITVTVMNGSAATPFTIQRVSTTNSVFPVTAAGLPATVTPGNQYTATIGFTPTSSAGYLDTFTVMTGAGACGMTAVSVVGIGQTPGVQVSRGGADFGPIRVGQTSAPVSFTVTNVGDGPFTVSTVALSNPTDFTLSLVTPGPGGYPILLQPNQSISFEAAAAPTTAGLKMGSVIVTTDIPGAGPTTLSLQVVGVAPGVMLSDNSVDFGAVDIRGAGQTRTVSVTNDGTAVLTVASAGIGGADADKFIITTGPPTPFTVPPSGTASFIVAYHPTAENAGETASLRISSDAPGEMMADIPLSGRGVDRHLDLSSTRVDFGATFQGRIVQKTLTLKNLGGAPLGLGSPAYVIDGTGATAFSVPNAFPASVAPGAQADITLAFNPAGAGSFTANLTIRSDDGDAPMAVVTLVGTATAAPVTVAPLSLAGDLVPVGTTRRLSQTVEITNVSTTETIAIMKICGGAGVACDETIFRADPAGPTSLAPGAKLQVGVDFSPKEAKVYTGRVLVFLDAGDPQFFVEVSGEGVGGVSLHGGGCQTAGGGGALAILLVLAVLSRRRAALLVLLAAADAAAQSPTAFDLRVFRPRNAEPGSFITVERPGILPEGALGVGLYFNFAKNPLVAERSGGEIMGAAVETRSEMALLATYGLLGRAELGLSLPLVIQSGSPGMTGVTGASGTALGDVGIDARVPLYRGESFGLAISAGLTLPTGDADQYAGAGSVTGAAALIAGTSFDRVRLSGNVGVRLRGQAAEIAGTRQATEIRFGLGVGVRLAAPLDAIGEIYGAFGLVDQAASASPLEAILGLRWWAHRTVAVTAGGGAGLHSGVGASDFRLFAGVTFAPGASAEPERAFAPETPLVDTDGDGIPDIRDKCPNEPEDFDNFEDQDGCPELDNDHDGISDEKDRCPNEAEDRDGYQDDDGCPDPDNDGDGIPDVRDKCPNEAEDRDGFQDEDGCFDPDNDGDGIPDLIDQCVMEPETINGYQDDDGCPDAGDPAVVVRADRLELIKPLEFRGDRLKPTAANVIGQIFATLRAHPEIVVLRIATSVPRGGSSQSDYRLSERRGQAVRKALVARGVDGKRLEVKPIGSSKARGVRAEDDRVELWILEKR
jgi:uncharacterized protein (TIGR03382 family)